MVNKADGTTNSKAKKHQTENQTGINNNENINNNNKNKKLILPFNSNSFNVKWSTLLKEKHWMGKSETALKTALKKLAEAGEEASMKMMDNTIIGGWKGLFDLEEKKITKNEGKVITKAQDLVW